MSGFSETVFGVAQAGEAYFHGTFINVDAEEGIADPVVDVMFDIGGEDLSIQFDAYHMREFRIAAQHAEKWLNEQETSK